MILTMLIVMLCPGMQVQAASGKTTLALSSGTLNIGDTVTVTARAMTESGGKAIATMTISYDASMLEFVSCTSSTYGGGGGSITATTDLYSITLKAISAGTSRVSLSAADGVDFDATAELDSMEGSSAPITVNNAASSSGGGSTGGDNDGGGNTGGSNTGTPALSADNSLKTLTISPGTLSPAFSGSRTSYSATVDNDVTSIAVSAVPVNEKASVESVTGNSNLVVGENTVSIVVKAENGTTATYKIKVTRQAAGETTTEPSESEEETPTVSEDDILVNNSYYRISSGFLPEELPAGFTETMINYHGTEYKGGSFNQGTLNILYLTDPGVSENAGSFFIYDETRDTFYNFAKMNCGESYVIALQPPVDYAMPENYFQTSFSLADGTTVTAYQVIAEEGEINDFYLFYGISHNGTEGWYRYDSVEGTYQRYQEEIVEADDEADGNMTYLQESYNTLSDKYKKEKSFSRNVMFGLGLVIAVLIIIIINMLVFGRNKADELDEEEDWADEDEDALTEDVEDIYSENTKTSEEKEQKKDDIIDLNR